MSEKEDNIIKLLKKGYSFNKIATELKIDYKEILKIKKDMIETGKLTEQDIKDWKQAEKIESLKNNVIAQKIFEYKKQGLSSEEISKKPGINLSRSSVDNYLEEGIKFKLITQEEINNAKYEKVKNRRMQDPLTIKIIEGLKRGETYKEISRNIPISDSQIKNITQWLIEEKVITQKQIDEAKEKYKNEPKQKENNTEILEEQQIIDYLTLGYDNFDIRMRHPKLDNEVFLSMQNELIENKKITRKEIKKYRQKRKEKDKTEIVKMLKKGITQKDIAKELLITDVRMQTYLKEIRKEQNISKEDIKKWKDNLEDSMKNKKIAVLEGTRLGWSVQEIVDKNPELNLTYANVVDIRKVLVKEKTLAKGKIQEYKKNKKQNEEIYHELNELEKNVLAYLKKGLQAREIVEKTNKSRGYIFEIIARLKKRGNITEQEIKKCREQRKNKKLSIKIKDKNHFKTGTFSKLDEKNMEKLKTYFNNAEKIKRAMQIIKNGNNNTEIINEVTGLPKEYIDILKIKLNQKDVKFLNINKREKIIGLLLQYKNLKELYQKLQMTDLEIRDIEEQTVYRNKKLHTKKINNEIEIKQDSLTRIVVLYTKLGKNKEDISEILGMKENEIESILNNALETGMIKNNELQGVNLLDAEIENKQLDFEEK